MAIFEGTVQEFHHFIGPRIKNAVNVFSKRERDARKGICEHCNETFRELESAHVHGKGRRTLIEETLSDYHIGNGVVRCDLGGTEKQILANHNPITEVFKFLCKECHDKYDSSPHASAESSAWLRSVASASRNIGTHRNGDKVDLRLIPADEAEFKAKLIERKKAFFVLHRNDGQIGPIEEWNASNFQASSNLRGNIMTGQLRNWKEKGIIKARFAICRSDLLDGDPIDRLVD